MVILREESVPFGSLSRARRVLRSKRGVELVFEFRAQLILRYCISARNSDPGLTPVTKSQSRARVQATYSSDLSVL